jgi:GNAT superfamily N-acetyltransferase
MSVGQGVVVSCDAGRVEWAREHLSRLSRDDVFAPATMRPLGELLQQDGQFLAGPDLKYLCSAESLTLFEPPPGIDASVMERDEIPSLYDVPGFGLALRRTTEEPRHDALATVARHDGKVVGIAGATHECETLWQIGIEIAPEHQGRGVGKALVSRLAEAVIRAGRIPYYSTRVSNIHSQTLAVRVGFWPAWTELYARDLK